MKKEKLFKIFLYLWLIGSLISFVAQFFFSTSVASLSLWGHSIGWQREIALWNLGIVFAIIYALKMKKLENLKFITLVLVAISLVLGTNHFVTMVANQKVVLTHILGVIFNYFIVVFGFYVFRLK